MSRRTGLGRGLDALIPGSERPSAGAIQQVLVTAIEPNPRQPRQQIDPGELEELAASIREYGVLQPLILTYEPGEPERFILIAGQRRLLAARLAGLESVPALLREASEQQRLELALIENVQRTDLNALEQAEAFRQLSDEFGLSHEAISTRVGKSRASITNTLRLLKLPEDVRSALAGAEISEGHARALLALATPQAQSAALEIVLKQALSVRQTEELVRRLSGQRPESRPKPAASPEVRALEERLRQQLGTRVSLNRRGRGGTLVIHFYSDEELDALVDNLLGEE
jgi:ParB family transcriptional regulator, chromosome partitioning protein